MRSIAANGHTVTKNRTRCLRVVRASQVGYKQAHRPLHTAFPVPADRPLRVLGIESSADDSCCAIVNSDRKVLTSQVVKQHHINAKYGGIHPLKAQEGHAVGVPTAIAAALHEAQLTINDVDAIAYTRGPGMYGCLAVGAASAQALAAAAGKPVIGIHHMQAHALTPLLTEATPPQYPFLVLLVSGGHTQLVLAKGLDEFEIVMDKVDNSIGDVFDKIARALELPHSPTRGLGAILEEYAARPPSEPYISSPLPPLPIPLQRPKRSIDAEGQPLPIPPSGTEPRSYTLAFSYAGLRSSTERLIAEVKASNARRSGGQDVLHEEDRVEISRVFQEAAVGHLVMQLDRALELPVAEARLSGRSADIRVLHGPEKEKRDGATKLGQVVKGLVVSGGVASNQYLRKRLEVDLAGRSEQDSTAIPLHYPPIELCTDNAAMIAWAAILRIQGGAKPERYGLPIRVRWSLEDLYDDESLAVEGSWNPIQVNQQKEQELKGMESMMGFGGLSGKKRK